MAVSWRGHTAAAGWIRRQAIHQIEATKPTLARTFPGEVFIWTGVIAVRGGILAHGGLLARNRPTNWNKLGHTAAGGWIRRQAIHQIEATQLTLARTFPGEVFILTGVIAVRGGILGHGGLLARNRPTCSV